MRIQNFDYFNGAAGVNKAQNTQLAKAEDFDIDFQKTANPGPGKDAVAASGFWCGLSIAACITLLSLCCAE